MYLTYNIEFYKESFDNPIMASNFNELNQNISESDNKDQTDEESNQIHNQESNQESDEMSNEPVLNKNSKLKSGNINFNEPNMEDLMQGMKNLEHSKKSCSPININISYQVPQQNNSKHEMQNNYDKQPNINHQMMSKLLQMNNMKNTIENRPIFKHNDGNMSGTSSSSLGSAPFANPSEESAPLKLNEVDTSLTMPENKEISNKLNNQPNQLSSPAEMNI